MLLLVLLLALLPHDVRNENDYVVEPGSSLFSVITHKGGVASGFAHNHLISASGMEATLSMPDSDPARLTFNLVIEVDSLQVDVERRWSQRIAELGLEDKLGSPGSSDRRKIERSMRGSGQLDSNIHKLIEAHSVSVQRADSLGWCSFMSYRSDVEITIKGVSQIVDFELCVNKGDKFVEIEAVGSSTFTAFGIRPYSGFLGAVKNKDGIDFYSFIVANRKSITG